MGQGLPVFCSLPGRGVYHILRHAPAECPRAGQSGTPEQAPAFLPSGEENRGDGFRWGGTQVMRGVHDPPCRAVCPTPLRTGGVKKRPGLSPVRRKEPGRWIRLGRCTGNTGYPWPAMPDRLPPHRQEPAASKNAPASLLSGGKSRGAGFRWGDTQVMRGVHNPPCRVACPRTTENWQRQKTPRLSSRPEGKAGALNSVGAGRIT